MSLWQQGMNDCCPVQFALILQTSLVAFLCYFKWLNGAFGTRMIAFPHFAIPALSFFMITIVGDEARRYFLRRGMTILRTTGRIKFDGWVVRNTFW